jgi:transcriptional regulator with XRE-family HTH domain
MEKDFDLARFGERLREIRSEREMTLREVTEETGISIQTLSRVERGEATEIESKTLLNLAAWAKQPLEIFQAQRTTEPPKTIPKGASTPDVVELYLRADKRLNPKTAELLAKMFRAAYMQAKSEGKE